MSPRFDRRASCVVLTTNHSSIQAKIAALFGGSVKGLPSKDARTGARVCKFKTPELLDSDRASKNEQIQREVEALRKLKRVDNGSKVIAKTKAFGGDGPSNAPLDIQKISLIGMSVLEKVKEEVA